VTTDVIIATSGPQRKWEMNPREIVRLNNTVCNVELIYKLHTHAYDTIVALLALTGLCNRQICFLSVINVIRQVVD